MSPARGLSAGQRETFWRTLQTFNATRLAIAVVLLLFLSYNNREGYWVFDQFLYLHTCVAYLGMALLALVMGFWRRRHFSIQVLVGIAVDIGVMSTFYIAAGGARSGLSILFLFPLAGGAILLPLVPALSMASLVTLVMLGQSTFDFLRHGAEPAFSQAGLAGAAFFAAVLVLNRLAVSLLRQEQLAGDREASLQAQQAINRIIMADTGDGILVIDDDTRLYMANPMAERMLGLSSPQHGTGPRLSDLPWMTPVVDAFHSWQTGPQRSEDAAPFFVLVRPGEGASTLGLLPRRDNAVHARLRFVAAVRGEAGRERSIVFLEDVSEIENRAQQLKLASMGRLTASIAHEVRNPLSAISYAISLLAEEELDPAQRRLAQIVDENTVRLNRLIEDILKLSRRAQPGGAPLDLGGTVAGIIAEFEATEAVRPGVIALDLPGRIWVNFDPMHLREVIVNLLSNALRYASNEPGSIAITALGNLASGVELHVQDDGPGISAEVRAHLFEPFYTTSSKGTGLGLYLARELCLNNGAMLDYEYRTESGEIEAAGRYGRFVITFPKAG